jgi:hypothetical protein
MRSGMRVPYHARAPQQREQRSRFGHWKTGAPAWPAARRLFVPPKYLSTLQLAFECMAV